jgi:hypothetical protein
VQAASRGKDVWVWKSKKAKEEAKKQQREERQAPTAQSA